MRLANSQAEEKGWVMVQDTAWEGYEDIPAWIMQGYGTMGYEAHQQLPEKPTHIFLQAGVGSMAGAITGSSVPCTAPTGPSSPLWSPIRPTACTVPPRRTTAHCILSPAR